MAEIVFNEGPLKGQTHEVPEAGFTIGRSPACDLCIPDVKISGEHALLRAQDGRWWLYDLQSTNGTLVNDKKTEADLIKEGDRVTLGESIFVFHPEGGSASKTDAPKTEQRRKPPTKPVADTDSSRFSVSIEGDDLQVIKELNEAYERMTEQLGRVIVGQTDVIEEVLIAIFCRGHALLVGVPGVAKTLLVSTLSHVLDLSYKRVQFTPDLMPADITGTDVLEEDQASGKRSFRFVQGPIFANMVLADEINRTPPKTQAALLEAMQEHRVTVGDKSYHLPEPFFVLATQNPIEQEGTYPLPEAQLDRFMFNVWLDYPSFEEEVDVVKNTTFKEMASPEMVISGDEIIYFQDLVRRIPLADNVYEYAVNLASMTRPGTKLAHSLANEYVNWGAGPRASQYMILGAKCHAALKGKYSPDIEDVNAVAVSVLRHRIVRNYKAEAEGISVEKIIAELTNK